MTMASFTVRNVQYAVFNLGLTEEVILSNGCPKDPNEFEPDPVLRRLKAVLTHPIGDYAVQPRDATWAAHGITQAHYLQGASYTVGATQNISIRSTSMVREFGGEVLVDATVKEIIGGIDYGYEESGPAASTDYVQLYGCPGDHNEVTLFPRRVREAGAIYIPSADGDEEYVLVCGGYQCPRSDPGCLEMSADCFTWFPSTNEWERIDDLELPRRDHIIVNVRICPLHQL